MVDNVTCMAAAAAWGLFAYASMAGVVVVSYNEGAAGMCILVFIY
jgi:hypothetical protein